MKKEINSNNAPQAIGPYSQAIRVDNTVYLSGQIPTDPITKELVKGDFKAQAEQVMANLKAVVSAAGGSLDDLVKLTVYLTDLQNFQILNEVMQNLFNKPYPARATIEVQALPKGAEVEIDAILYFPK